MKTNTSINGVTYTEEDFKRLTTENMLLKNKILQMQMEIDNLKQCTQGNELNDYEKHLEELDENDDLYKAYSNMELGNNN